MSRFTFAIGIALLVVEESLAVAILVTSPGDDIPWPAIVLAATAGGAFVVSGLIALALRPENRTGLYLAATGYLWFLGALSNSGNEWVFTAGYMLGNLVWVPFTALVLAYPTGQFESRLERWIPTVTGVLLITPAVLAALVDSRPGSPCDSCPGSAIAVVDHPGAGAALDTTVTIAGLVLVALVLVALARRWRRATPALRRLLWPVAVSGSAVLLSVALLVTVDAVSSSAGDVLQFVFFAAFTAVPISFLFGILRVRLARASISELMLAIGAGMPLRDALAGALGDPSLAIVYPLESRWVDVDGRDADTIVNAENTILTPVEVDEEIVAGLVHDASLTYDPAHLDGVVGAAALALRAQGLQAETRGQFAFLRTLVETAPSLFIHVGTDGRIRNQNAAAVEAAGYEDQELVRGRYFWDVFIDPAERDEVITRFRALAPTFEQGEYENAFTNLRGEQRVIFWRSAPVHSESGEVAGIISGGIDITERRHHELDLERERDVQSTVFESMPSIMVVLAPDGTIRDRDVGDPSVGANRAFREAVRWPNAELVGRPFLDLVVEDADGRARRAIAAAAQGSASETVESELRSADGTSRTFAWSAIPVSDVTGRLERVVLVSGLDVTERRRREFEDRQRRAFMEAVTESIPSFLLVLRPDGAVRENGANRAFTTAFGWTDSEIAGQGFVGAVVPADDREAAMAIVEAAAGSIRDEIESRWETRDGGSRIVAWSARPVADAQGEQMILVSGMDVTTRRMQEEEIRASRVRIVSAADEARRRLERDLHDGAQQRLVSLSVMLSLAESRLGTGTGDVDKILTDARTELNAALEELRELARGIHPAILSDRGLGPALEALVARTPLPVVLELTDGTIPSEVEAAAYFVVAEALTNVVKYAAASRASVEIDLAGEIVSVVVCDDGIGGADPRNGTGLRGLADRLSSLDGSLVVESAPGRGTCVRAEIPCHERVRN